MRRGSHTVDPATGHDVAEARLARRWLAHLYLAAGVLGIVNSVLPGYPGFDIPRLVTLSVASLATGGLVLTLGHRLPRAALHALLAAGIASVAAAIHFTQGVPNAAALLYLWTALYAFYFFSRRAAFGHMALVAASYAVAIALRPPPFPPVAHWLTTVLMMVMAGAFVGVLKGRLDDTMGRLARLADTDALTGLANRRGWVARAAVEMRRARREQQALAVALVDLDGFKAYNDEHGHAAGDRLLQECGEAWRAGLRDMDFVARLGGDEFAVLLPGCGPAAAVGIGERFRAVTPLGARVSVGIAHWIAGETIEQTMARADSALYQGKRGGGDRLVIAAAGGGVLAPAG